MGGFLFTKGDCATAEGLGQNINALQWNDSPDHGRLEKNTDNDVDIRSIKQAENAIATFLVVDRSSHLLWKYEMILKKLLMSH